jgi:hypothetical protein
MFEFANCFEFAYYFEFAILNIGSKLKGTIAFITYTPLDLKNNFRLKKKSSDARR